VLRILIAVKTIEVPERLWEAIRPDNTDAVFHDADSRTVCVHQDRIDWEMVAFGVVIPEIRGIGLHLIDVSRSHAAALEFEHDESVRGEHDNVWSATALARQFVLQHHAPGTRLGH
jgi:hypothetical protein